VPRTIWPASHPAMSPTSNVIERLSFDMCAISYPPSGRRATFPCTCEAIPMQR
jgi:hypothetical protein